MACVAQAAGQIGVFQQAQRLFGDCGAVAEASQ
jgi:hypothetical protein